MDDLTFLRDANKGNFRVVVQTADGKTLMIYNLNTNIIKTRCPALVKAAEDKGHGEVYIFENKSLEAVVSLLRHIYVEDYTFCEAGLERPCSLMLHLEVYELARMFDMADLQSSVRSYIFAETERFHETQAPVHGFYEGIAFLYTTMRDCKDLRDVIADYCVNRFAHFNFAEQELFRQTAFGSPMFHKDLQQANVRSEFKNEAAAQIVQLPVCEHWIHTMNVDFACHHHSPVDENGGCTTPTPERIDAQIPSTDNTMALRSREDEATAGLSNNQATPSNKQASVPNKQASPPNNQPAFPIIQAAIPTRPKPNARHEPDFPATPPKTQAPPSKYWRDAQPTNTGDLPHNKRFKLDDGPRPPRHPPQQQHHQSPFSTTLMSHVWNVLGDEHDPTTTSTTNTTTAAADDSTTDDEWTQVDIGGSMSSKSRGEAGKRGSGRGGKQKWIVGAEEENAGGIVEGVAKKEVEPESEVESEAGSEWSVVSWP